MTFALSCVSTPDVDARQAYSSIQGNIREEAEIEPYEGGKKVGPVHDWELLCKIEGDETLKELVIKSAEEGSLDHVFILACMNLHGKGIDKNQIAAFELFKAAANRGHSNSQNNLGFLFEEGVGSKKDLKQALTWYKKAADYNNPSALCNLGNMYEHGRGVPANADEALKLYQKSSELGNRIARQNVYGIEFEREGKYKLKGIEITQGAAPSAQQPASSQRTMTYNPDSSSFARKQTTAVALKPATAPAAVTTLSAAVKAPEAATTTAPPVVAKVDPAKNVSANDLVLNSLIAKSKAAAAAKAAQPAVAKDKNGKPATVAVKAAEKAPVVEAPAPVVAEVKPAESGLSAGTPTLTAILNRLSKGTSMEQTSATEQKVAEAVKEPAKEVVATSAPKAAEPKAESKVAPTVASEKARKQADKVKEDAAEKLIASMKKSKEKQEKHEKQIEKKAEKKAEPAEKQVGLLTSNALLSSNNNDKPAVVPTKQEKPAIAKAPEKPAAVAIAPKVEKPVAAVETKPVVAEVKKSALDTPVVAPKSPVKVDTKPITATAQASAKPAAATTVVAAKPPATTSSATKKSDVLVDKGANRPIRDKWALVIGITDFQDPDIPDLQFSAKDATDFYNYLVNEANFQPDHVRLLLNEQATQRRVLSELGSKFLARVVKPDDLVVLYFSTHGSPSQLDPRGKNYLVANDSDSDDLFATGIEMQKLLDSIQGRVLTDRVLLVMDACHSGFAAPDAKGMSRLGNFKADDLVQGSGQLVICSSLADERAWESTRYQNGVFTRKLLDGLRSKGTATTLVDAYSFARDAVGHEIKEDRPGAKQTPILKGKWDGNDLVVATPAYAPQMIPSSVSASLGTDSRNALVASGVRPQSQPQASDDDSYSSKPSNDAAPRSGVIYLDSQFFSVKGDPRTLAKELYDAIKNNPSDPDLYFMRAKALIQLEDWHSAIASLSEAIQMSPNRAQYYLGRAYVNYRMGKKGIAQQDLEQAKFYDQKMSNNVRFHM